MESFLINVQKFWLLEGKFLLRNNHVKCFGTTSSNFLNRKWREERGLPENPNSFGPLTNLPDFTYIDGRPSPLGSNLRKRLAKQRQYVETILRLTKEVDFAVERHDRMKREEEEKRQGIMSNKLKSKGTRMLNDNS